jgi:hypothetical protein
MVKSFTRIALLGLMLAVGYSLQAQTVITQWNFNSNPPDASTGTGTTNPSVGTGTITTVNTNAPTFNAGTGSSDPVTTDNSGIGMTGFPAQGVNSKSSGIRFGTSTATFQNIIVRFDLRHSNTAARHFTVQYTLNNSVTTPVWVDFAEDSTTAGDVFVNNRTYNMSAITGLNNNANAGFRVVSSFRPNTSEYISANTGLSSAYAPGGTWRFDMVTVLGTGAGPDVTPPVAQSYIVTSGTTSYIKFNEPVTTTTATNIANYVFNPALSVTNAVLSASADTVFLTHAPFVNGQPYTLTVSGVQDVAGNAVASTNFTAVYNASLPNLVITEIIHSPNDIESIEVYNAGTTAVNLGGLRWTDGTTGNFPQVSLAAGAVAVFATAPATASTSLNVTPVYLINNGLGASDDILVIRNALNQVVDSVQYFVGTNGWPTAPTGVYGYSFELNAAANDNNVGANWFVPQNTVTPTPAVGVIRATMGMYPTPPFTPASATVSFVGGVKRTVSETTTTVSIVANLQGGGASPSSIDIEVLPISTATNGSDFTLPASLKFGWAANASNVNDTIVITINNDALPENAEYFMVRFVNPVNILLPSAASNHFTVAILDDDKQAPTASQSITLNHIASFSNGVSGSNSAEIVAHDPVSQRLFIANSIGAKIDIVNFRNPSAATLIASIPMVPTYGNINSIAVKNGIVAAAIENNVPESPGKVVFFDTTGTFISQVNVGAMPDMIVFDSAGTKVFTANEGQPRTNYLDDPEGSVTIINISGGVANVTQANVTTAGFAAFNSQAAALRSAGVRIFGRNATVAQDMEPEYITIAGDSAYVTCQENNALAVIYIPTSTVTAIRPLGLKDHSLTRNALDISDQGSSIEIANWPVKGVYMPDAIASYSVGGQTYLVTANEGDAREYDSLNEVARISAATYVLDSAKFPYRDALKANIGRLNITTASGDTDGDGDYDEIHAYGARSISIWNAATGALVWDSGDDMEMVTSKDPVFGAIFNASNANNTLKNRSDDKGPEPEGVALASIGGKTFAFVALERIGGCMVYDVTNPASPIYVDYKNTRTVATYGGDQGAEGIVYVTAANSPTGVPIVILANEVSSTLSFFSVNTSALDISLGNIKARNIGSRNQVEWTTVAEAKGDIFEIERSKDGVTFNFLSNIQAKGLPSTYSLDDNQPFAGTTYYRLKLKHVSGRVTYSPIVTAFVKGTTALLQVYPNPVKNQLTIKTTADLQWINRTVDIVDVKGVVLRKVRLTAQQTTVDVSNLPMGIYNLRYIDNNQVQSIKVTKQ